MIKVEVIKNFTYGKFKELKNVKKVAERKEDLFGYGDTFECDKATVDYLIGGNALKDTFVKVLEVIPEKVEEPKKEVKEEKKEIKQNSNKKKNKKK